MKDDEKDKETGTEPSGEPMEEPKKLDRGAFLKVLGVGMGAVGLGMATGGQLSARTAPEPDSSRSAIQTLMRGLLENPSRAKDFLNSPQTVAEELGVRLTEADANKIKEVFTKLALEVGGGPLHEGYSIFDHVDNGHHNKYSKTYQIQQKKGQGGETAPKPPTGTKRSR